MNELPLNRYGVDRKQGVSDPLLDPPYANFSYMSLSPSLYCMWLKHTPGQGGIISAKITLYLCMGYAL